VFKLTALKATTTSLICLSNNSMKDNNLKNKIVLAQFSAFLLVFLTGCEVVPTPPPEPYSISIDVPMITPLPETLETQVRSDVSITLAPVAFRSEVVDACRYSGSSAFAIFPPPGASLETHTAYNQTQTSILRMNPEGLTFVVTIRNNMDRVFRGAGALITMNVDGRTQGLEQSAYADFINVLVPPRSEAQVFIQGPDLETLLQDAGILAVFLYDVVTGMDNAGNITNRENFEWFFNISEESRSEVVQESTPRLVWIPNGVVNRLAAEGGFGMGIYDCVQN
jgi:hypothetical protein